MLLVKNSYPIFDFNIKGNACHENLIKHRRIEYTINFNTDNADMYASSESSHIIAKCSTEDTLTLSLPRGLLSHTFST